jgi:hypothetical protein
VAPPPSAVDFGFTIPALTHDVGDPGDPLANFQ